MSRGRLDHRFARRQVGQRLRSFHVTKKLPTIYDMSCSRQIATLVFHDSIDLDISGDPSGTAIKWRYVVTKSISGGRALRGKFYLLIST